MDSSQSPECSDAGYATAMAMVLALGLSLMATALVAHSVMILRLARADFARAAAEDVLDGAQLQAAATVIRAGSGGPYLWGLPTDMGIAEALVESEGEKLSPEAAAALPDEALLAYGITDPDALKARLAAVPRGAIADIAALDAAPLWRECGPSLVSSLGVAERYAPQHPAEPSTVPAVHGLPNPPAWRVGEAWRVRVTTATGWRDDRIVRFTGDARHPVAVVWRHLSRGDGGQGRCDAIWAAGA